MRWINFKINARALVDHFLPQVGVVNTNNNFFDSSENEIDMLLLVDLFDTFLLYVMFHDVDFVDSRIMSNEFEVLNLLLTVLLLTGVRELSQSL